MYKKYGDEWEKEVMKNPKKTIVEMLRRVAIERDKLEAVEDNKDIDDPDIMATHFAAEVENGERKPLKIVKTVRLGGWENPYRMKGAKFVNMYVFERTE